MAARDVVVTTATRPAQSRGPSTVGSRPEDVGPQSQGGTPPQLTHGVSQAVVPPTTRVFNTAAGSTLRHSKSAPGGYVNRAKPRRSQTNTLRMPGLCGSGLLSFLLLPHAVAYESPFDPTCPAAPTQQLTLQGESTGPWEDIDWLNSHGGDELVGAAYANVPPMSLLPGDKLAFDTSVLGTDAMNLTLSLSSCKPTSTVGASNSEDGLTYTCEETLMPEHTVRLLSRVMCSYHPCVCFSDRLRCRSNVRTCRRSHTWYLTALSGPPSLVT